MELQTQTSLGGRAAGGSIFGTCLGLACAGLVVSLAGCSHSRGIEEMQGGGLLHVLTPQAPAFLTGPASVLLTNASGYTARAELQTQDSLDPTHTIAGQLFCRGSKLLFAPGPAGGGEKHGRVEGFSFIWDVAAGTGYVLSEPLQGYAPLTSRTQVTNLIMQTVPAMPQKLAGYLCTQETAELGQNNGSTGGFTVFRAKELNAVPTQLTALSNSTPFTLTLSKVRLEPAPAELFSVPDGFSQYTSAEAMADEQAARQRILKQRNRKGSEPFEYPGSEPTRRY